MTPSSQPQKKFLIPIWAQIAVALAVGAIVFKISGWSPFYSSEWVQVDSNFYDGGTQALKYSGVNIYQGPTPTMVVFWEKDCKACKESIQFLREANPKFFIAGVHLKADAQTKTEARRWWVQNAPRQTALYFDDSQMLEKTFHIRVVPHSFLIYPLKNEMRSLTGNIQWGKPRLETFNRSH